MNSQNEHLLTMGDIADRLQVEPHTIRRWVKYHKIHLSQYAKPTQPGRARRFTEKDVQVLGSVRSLRAQGLTVEQVNERLSDMTFGEVELPEPTDLQPIQAAQEGPGAEIALLTAVDSLKSIQTHLETLAPLAARVEALEAQRLRFDAVWLSVACFVAGLVVGLAVWWFQ